jgi:hypothetical protein
VLLFSYSIVDVIIKHAASSHLNIAKYEVYLTTLLDYDHGVQYIYSCME